MAVPRYLLLVLLFLFLVNTSAWVHVDCPGTKRLGVGLGYIRDSQMTSSSHLSSKYQPWYGRLYSQSAWCPGKSPSNSQIPQSNAWLQVDLVVSHFICAVGMQGSNIEDRWVTMYMLSYSTDEKNWLKERYYSTGNYNRNTPQFSHPYQPRLAKYVRFNVAKKRYHKWPCMRVELYGQKVWDLKKNFIIFYHNKMHVLASPTGVVTIDGRGNIRSVEVTMVTKIPNQSHKTKYDHALTKNMEVWPDMRPRASSLYSGSDVLMVLPKARYLPGKIVSALGNNLYEIRRADNGKTEIMRRDYLRIKGLDPCELDNECPPDTTCKNDELHRTARYYCVCKPGFVETYNGISRLMKGKCTDIDECKDVSTCNQNSICVNTPGSHECNCNSGYTKTLNNKCFDVDECALSPSPCSSGFSCHNTAGSYKCKDTDECLSSPCWEGENCINTHGSFRCEIPERVTEKPKDVTMPLALNPTKSDEPQDITPSPTVQAQELVTNPASLSSCLSCCCMGSVLLVFTAVLAQF